MTKLTHLNIVFAGIISFCFSLPSEAELITYQFEATINGAFGSLGAGTVLSGEFSFDSEQSGTDGLFNTKRFELSGLSLSDGSESIDLNIVPGESDGWIVVGDDYPIIPGEDLFTVRAEGFPAFTGTLGGLVVDNLYLIWTDADGSANDGYMLPLDESLFSEYESATINFQGSTNFASGVIISITSVDGGTVDTDGDGIVDTADNCPVTANPIQACSSASDCLGPTNMCNVTSGFCSEQNNNDGDADGDVCDADDDNDGWADEADNCPLVANLDQSDADYDGIGDACDGAFTTNTAVAHIINKVDESVSLITSANTPGGNGLISKLTGTNGVVPRADNAVSAFDAGLIDLQTYMSELQAALSKLDTYENQLAAKIKNGEIIDPEALQLLDASTEIRLTINNLMAGA